MKITNLDSKLVECIDKYSTTQAQAGTALLKSVQKAQDAEMIVPVIGLQGKGKSTIINALLEENILPNEAGETTCAPIEVKYGALNSAKVHFIGKDDCVSVQTKDEMAQYVDNDYNPGNKKQVAYIESFRNVDLLKSGLVIVDLPGVGSLTKENEDTTKRYIQDLCSAIFVISVTPTILNSEAMFIKAMWSQFSKAIFIEHDWDEPDDEIKESCEYNTKRLKQIARELNHPDEIEMLVVNGYEALHGSLNKDAEERQRSNISALTSRLGSLAQNWETERGQEIAARVLLTIEAAINSVKKQIADLKKSREQVEDENRERLNEFRRGTEAIENKVRSIRKTLRDEQFNMESTAKRKVRDCVDQIKVELFNVVDGGVVDGSKLSQAFSDIQQDKCQSLFNEMFDVMQEVKFKLEDGLQEIQEIAFENKMKVSQVAFNKDESIKWEKGASWVIGVGGATVAALKSGAVAAFLVSNPAGWVIAGVGLAITALFGIFGSGIRKAKQKARIEETKSELRPKFGELEDKLLREIIKKIDEFCNAYSKAVDGLLENRRQEEKAFEESLKQSVQVQSEDGLNADLAYLEQAKAKDNANI